MRVHMMNAAGEKSEPESMCAPRGHVEALDMFRKEGKNPDSFTLYQQVWNNTPAADFKAQFNVDAGSMSFEEWWTWVQKDAEERK